MTRAATILAFGLLLTTCGRTMTTPDPKPVDAKDAAALTSAPFLEAPLPVEPEAGSELLAATHVFAIELRSTRATPWVPGEGGLTDRKVAMQVALGEVLKGSFQAKPGEVFPFEVEQHRVRNPMGDHPGMWSRLEAEPGARYVFASRGNEQSTPADLMREGACLRVLPGDRAIEVHLARGAERVFQAGLASASRAPDPQAAAARALATFAAAHVPAETDVFGRYLWARVQPTFLRSSERPTLEVLTLLTAPAASKALRIELEAGLDAVAQALGKDLAFAGAVGAGYFALLLDPGASALHHRLVEVSLYFLLVPNDQPYFPAEKVFPDASARARYVKALAPLSSARARRLAAWLSG